ncbi:MAG: LEA14-like dessication related protein [Oceanicoccus sp.]|jgi:LEA14-like dessication related protein
MLTTRFTQMLAAVMILALSGCASLLPTFESPTVSVSAFRILPSDTLNPKFEIALHITNPNNTALNFQGVAYSASIEGHRILSGVSNDLPVIEAYGEGDVRLIASADLLGSFGLINDLMNKQRKNLVYRLNIKLDVGRFTPAIQVENTGTISLH